jgi:hypothetical protein
MNPRTQLPKDLLLVIRKKQAEGHIIIMGSDNNETPSEGRDADGCAKPGTMEDVFDRCSLRDVFLTKHGSSPATTTKTDGRCIDSLRATGITVTSCGILQVTATKDSDHFPLYFDWGDAATVIGGPLTPLLRPPQRRLSVKNDIIVSKYTSYAIDHAKYHNLEGRIDRLTASFLAHGRILSPPEQAMLFNLDKQHAEIRVAADKQCSRKGIHHIDWSPEYKATGNLVSYLEYRLKDRTRVGDSNSRKLGKKAGLTFADMDQFLSADVCRKQLSEARQWLKILKQEAGQQCRYNHHLYLS